MSLSMFVIGLLLLKLNAYFYVCGQLFYNSGHCARPMYGKDLDRKARTLIYHFIIFLKRQLSNIMYGI